MAQDNKNKGILGRIAGFFSGNDKNNNPDPSVVPVPVNKAEKRENKKAQSRPQQLSRAEINKIERDRKEAEKKGLVQKEQEAAASSLAEQQKKDADAAIVAAEAARIRAAEQAAADKAKAEAAEKEQRKENAKKARLDAEAEKASKSAAIAAKAKEDKENARKARKAAQAPVDPAAGNKNPSPKSKKTPVVSLPPSTAPAVSPTPAPVIPPAPTAPPAPVVSKPPPAPVVSKPPPVVVSPPAPVAPPPAPVSPSPAPAAPISAIPAPVTPPAPVAAPVVTTVSTPPPAAIKPPVAPAVAPVSVPPPVKTSFPVKTPASAPAPAATPFAPITLATPASSLGFKKGPTLGDLLDQEEKRRAKVEQRQAGTLVDGKGKPISPILNVSGSNATADLAHRLQEHGLIANDHWLAQLFPNPSSSPARNSSGGSGNGGNTPPPPPPTGPPTPPTPGGKSRRGFNTRYPDRPVLHDPNGSSGQEGWNNAVRPHMRNDGGMSTDSRGPLFKNGSLETGHDIAAALNEQYKNVAGFSSSYVESSEGKSGQLIITRRGNFSPIEIALETGKIGDRNVVVSRNKLTTDEYEYDNDKYGAEDKELRGFKRISAAQSFLNTVIGSLGADAQNQKGDFSDEFDQRQGHLMGLNNFSTFENLRSNAGLRRVIANTFSFGLSERYKQSLAEKSPNSQPEDLNKAKMKSIASSLSRIGYLQGAVGTNAGVMKGEGTTYDEETQSFVQTETSENRTVITHAAYNTSQIQNRRATKNGIIVEIDSSSPEKEESEIAKVDKRGSLYRENYLPENEGIDFYQAAGETGYNVTEVQGGPNDDVGMGSGIASLDLMNLDVYTERAYRKAALPDNFNLTEAQFESAGLRGDYNQGGGLLIRDSADADDPNAHSIRFNRMGLQGGRVLKDDQGRSVYDISLGYNRETVNLLSRARATNQIGLLNQFNDQELSEIFSVDTKIAQGKLRTQSRVHAESLASQEEAKGRVFTGKEREEFILNESKSHYKNLVNTGIDVSTERLRNAEKIQGSVAEFLNNRPTNNNQIVVRSSDRVGGGNSGETVIGWEGQSKVDALSNKTQAQKEATRGKYFNVMPLMRHGTKDERHMAENEAFASMEEMKQKMAVAAFGDEEAERYIYKTSGKGKDRKFVLKDETLGDTSVDGIYTNRVQKNLKSKEDFFGAVQGIRASIQKQAENQGIKEYENVSKNAQRIINRADKSQWDAGNEKEKRSTLLELASYRYGGKQSKDYKDFQKKISSVKMDSAEALVMWQEHSAASVKSAQENVRRIDPLLRSARQNKEGLQQKSLALASEISNSTFGRWFTRREKESQSQLDSRNLNQLFKEGSGPVLAKVSGFDATKNAGAYGRSILVGAYHSKESYFKKMRDIVRAEYGDNSEAAMKAIYEGDKEKADRVLEMALNAAPKVYDAGKNPKIQRLTKELSNLAKSSIETEDFREIYENGTYADASAKVAGKAISNPDEEEGQKGHKDWYWGKHMQVVQAVSNDLYERATKEGVTVDKKRLDLLVMTHDMTKALGLNDKDPDVVKNTLQQHLSKLGYSQDEIDYQIEANRHLEELKKDPKNNAHMSIEALMVSYADAASHATNSEPGKGITGFLHVFDRLTNPNGIREQKDKANQEKILDKDKNKMLGLQMRAPQILQGIGNEPSSIVRRPSNNNEIEVKGGIADYVNNLPGVKKILETANKIQFLRTNQNLDDDIHPDDVSGGEGRSAFPTFTRGVSAEYTGSGRITMEGLKGLAKQYPELYKDIFADQKGKAGPWDILFASAKNEGADIGGADVIDFNPAQLGKLSTASPSESQESQFKKMQQEYQALVADPNSVHKEDSLMRLTTKTGEHGFIVANPLSLRGLEQSAYGEAYKALTDVYKDEQSSSASIIQAQKIFREKEIEYYSTSQTLRKALGSISEGANTYFDRYTVDEDVADNEIVVGMRQVRLMAEQASKASGFAVSTGHIIKQLQSEEGMFGTVVRMPEVTESMHLVRMRFDENMKDHQLTKVSKFFNALFFGDQDADPQMTLGLGKWQKDATTGEVSWKNHATAKDAWENQQEGTVVAINAISRGMSRTDFNKSTKAAINTAHEVMKNRLETGYYDEATRKEIEASFDSKNKTAIEGGRYQKDFLKIAREGLIFGGEHEIRDAAGKGTDKYLKINALVSTTGAKFDTNGKLIAKGKEQNIDLEGIEDRKKNNIASIVKKFKNLKPTEVNYALIGAASESDDQSKKGMGIYNMIKSVNELMDSNHMEMAEKAFSPDGASHLDPLTTEKDKAKSTYKFVGSSAQKAKEGSGMEYQRAIDFAKAGPEVAKASLNFSVMNLHDFTNNKSSILNEGFNAFAKESTNMPAETIAMWFGDSEESMKAISTNLQAWHDSGRKDSDSYARAFNAAKGTTRSMYMRTLEAAAYRNTETTLSNPLKYLRFDRNKRAKLKQSLEDARKRGIAEDAVKIASFAFKGNAATSIASFSGRHMAPLTESKGYKFANAVGNTLIDAVNKIGAAIGRKDPLKVDLKTPGKNELDAQTVNSTGAQASSAVSPSGVSSTSTNSSGDNKIDVGPSITSSLVDKFNEVMGRTGDRVTLEEKASKAWVISPSELHADSEDTGSSFGPMNFRDVGFFNRLVKATSSVFGGQSDATKQYHDPSLIGDDGTPIPYRGIIRSIKANFELGNELEKQVFENPDYINDVGYRTKGAIKAETPEGHVFSGEPDVLQMTKNSSGEDVWEIKDIKLKGTSEESQKKFDEAVGMKNGKPGSYVVQQMAYREDLRTIAPNLIDSSGNFKFTNSELLSESNPYQKQYKNIHNWFLNNNKTEDEAHTLTQSLLKASLRKGGIKLGGILSGSVDETGGIVKGNDGKVVLDATKGGGFDEFQDEDKSRAKIIELADKARKNRWPRAIKVAAKAFVEAPKLVSEWRESRAKARQALQDPSAFNSYENDEDQGLHIVEHGIASSMPFMNAKDERKVTEKGLAKMAQTFIQSGAFSFKESDMSTPGNVANFNPVEPGSRKQNSQAENSENFFKIMAATFSGEGSIGVSTNTPGSNKDNYNQRKGADNARLEQGAIHVSNLIMKTGQEQLDAEKALMTWGVLRNSDDLNRLGIKRDSNGMITSSSDEVRAAFMKIVQERHAVHATDLLGKEGALQINPQLMPVRDGQRTESGVANALKTTLGRLVTGIAQAGGVFSESFRSSVTSSDSSNPLANNTQVQQAQTNAPVGAVQAPSVNITPAKIDYRGENVSASGQDASGPAAANFEAARNNLHDIAATYDSELAARISTAHHSELPELAALVHQKINDPEYNNSPSSGNFPQEKMQGVYAQAVVSMSAPEARSFFEGINPAAMQAPGVPELPGVETQRAALEASASSSPTPSAPVAAPAAVNSSAAPTTGGITVDDLNAGFQRLVTAIEAGPTNNKVSDGTNEVPFVADQAEITKLLEGLKVDVLNPSNSTTDYTETDLWAKSGVTGTSRTLGKVERNAFLHASRIIEKLKSGEAVSKEDAQTAHESFGRMGQAINSSTSIAQVDKDKINANIVKAMSDLELVSKGNSRAAIRERRKLESPAARKALSKRIQGSLRSFNDPHVTLTTSQKEYQDFINRSLSSGAINTDQAKKLLDSNMLSVDHFNDVELKDKDFFKNSIGYDEKRSVKDQWEDLTSNTQATASRFDEKLDEVREAKKSLQAFKSVYGSGKEIVKQDIYKSEEGTEYRSGSFDLKGGEIVDASTGDVVGKHASTRQEEIKVDSEGARTYKMQVEKLNAQEANILAAKSKFHKQINVHASAMAESDAAELDKQNHGWGVGQNSTREKFVTEKTESYRNDLVGDKNRNKGENSPVQAKRIITSMAELASHLEKTVSSKEFQALFGADGARLFHGLKEALVKTRDIFDQINQDFKDFHDQTSPKYNQALNEDELRAKWEPRMEHARAQIAAGTALMNHPGIEGESEEAKTGRKNTGAAIVAAGQAILAQGDIDNPNTDFGRAVKNGTISEDRAEDLSKSLTGRTTARAPAQKGDPLTRLLAAHTIMQAMSGVRQAFAGNEEAMKFYEGSVSASNSALSSTLMGSGASDFASGSRKAAISNEQYRLGRNASRSSNVFNGLRESGPFDMAKTFLQPALGTAMSLSAILPSLMPLLGGAAGGAAGGVAAGGVAAGAAGLATGVLPALVIGGAIAAGTLAIGTTIAGAAQDKDAQARMQVAKGNALRNALKEANPNNNFLLRPYAGQVGMNAMSNEGWKDWAASAALETGGRLDPEVQKRAQAYQNVFEASTVVNGRFPDGRKFTQDPEEIRAIQQMSSQTGSYKTIADSLNVSVPDQNLAASVAAYATNGWYNSGEGPGKVGTGNVLNRMMYAISRGEDPNQLSSKASGVAAAMGYYGISAGARYLGSSTGFDKYGKYIVTPEYTQQDLDKMIASLSAAGGGPEALATQAYQGGYGSFENTKNAIQPIIDNIKKYNRDPLTPQQGAAIVGYTTTNPQSTQTFKQFGFTNSESWKSFAGTPSYSYTQSSQYLKPVTMTAYTPLAYTVANQAGSMSYSMSASYQQANLGELPPDYFYKKLEGARQFGDNGTLIGLDPNKVAKIQQDQTLASMGQAISTLDPRKNPFDSKENLLFSSLDKEIGFSKKISDEEKAKIRTDYYINNAKSILKKMGFEETSVGFSEEAMSAGGTLMGVSSQIASYGRQSGVAVPSVDEFLAKASKNVNGVQVTNPDYTQNLGNLSNFVSNKGLGLSKTFGFDGSISKNLLGMTSSASSFLTNAITGNPSAYSYLVSNPEAIRAADALTSNGMGVSNAISKYGLEPIVSLNSGGERFARDLSGLKNPDYNPLNNSVFAPKMYLQGNISGATAQRTIEPMRQSLFGNSKISGAKQSSMYEAFAKGGIEGGQRWAANESYNNQIAGLGIQAAQINYNRERQLEWDFPMQKMNNEIQDASIFGGVVHTDFMKKHGISAMDYSGGTVLTKEMKDAGMTEGVTYEGGQLGLSKFNLSMDKLELIKGHQANSARMSWQFQDIAREKYQSSVKADWQREDFGMQERQMSLARGKQAYDFSYQAREMGISRQQFEEDKSFQNRQRQLQFGWQMEDSSINIRRSTGFERKQLIKQKERDTISFNMDTEQVNRGNKRQEEAFKREEEKFKKEMDHYKKSIALEDETFKKQKNRFEKQREWEEESFAIREGRAGQEASWADEAFKRQLMRLAVQENELKNEEKRAVSSKETRDAQYIEDTERAKKLYEYNLASVGNAIEGAKIQKANAEVIATLMKNQADALEATAKVVKDTDWEAFGVAIKELRLFAQEMKAYKEAAGPPAEKKKKSGEIPNQAFGGKVSLGSSYLVGEIGQEILNIGQDGVPRILPNSAIPKDRSISRSGSSEVIHIHVMMDSDEIATYTSGKANSLASRNRRRAFNG